MNHKNDKSDLKAIAAEMIAYARRRPRLNTSDDINQYRRQLSRGLRLVLYLDRYHTWRLSLYRGVKPPGPQEVAIIRRDFDIPASASQTTKNVHGWAVIRLSWPDPTRITQSALIDPASVAEPISNHYLSEEA